MSVTFRPAKRENVPLLLGFAGGTGSGKTLSALRVARGIAGGQPFVGIDTENGRMNHYADEFPELHRGELGAPFRPEAYLEAIAEAEAYLEKQGVPLPNRVIVVDSASHEWAGDGGCLDWHDQLTGGDKKKSPSAWAKIKPAHKKMVSRLLRVNGHVILCFRAEPKVDIVRVDGKVEFVPKKGPTGLDGWMPISEKMLPYELTASFLLMADEPGVPRPIKLEEQHKAFVPLDRPIDEGVGKGFAAWAAGGAARASAAKNGKPTGLTSEQLLSKRQEAGISDDLFREVGKRLFPGKAPSKLTNQERGKLWAELEKAGSW